MLYSQDGRSYYLKIMKTWPMVKLSQVITVLKPVFCDDSTAQDPVSSIYSNNLLNRLNICQFVNQKWIL